MPIRLTDTDRTARRPPTVFVRLRGDVDFAYCESSGRGGRVLHDRATGKFFHLGEAEAAVAARMTEPVSVEALGQAISQDDCGWSVEDLRSWISTLVKAGLATLRDADGNEIRPAEPEGRASGGRRDPDQLLKEVARPLSTLLSQRFPLGCADPIARRLCPWLGRLFTPAGVAVASVAGTVALAAVVSHSRELGEELRSILSPATWPLVASLWFVLKVIHELGHAVAAKRHGVRVGNGGVMLFMLAPLAYIDVTDAWRLPRTWARVQIALGGVYFELLTAIIAVFLYLVLPDGLPRHLAAQWMILGGPATLLVNANPLLRLDGYYALSDALNIPNLRMHGRGFWKGVAERRLLGIEPPPSLLEGWRHRAAAVHAVASLVFQILWMTGLVIAVSKWAGLLGLLLAVAAALLWGVLPPAGWLLRHWRASDAGEDAAGLLRRRLRLAAVGAAITAGFTAMMFVPNPFVRAVPVMVQFRDEQVARAAADGFVTEVHVRAGQNVRRGDLLMVISDDDLMLRYVQMQDERELAHARKRQLLRKGELAAAAAQSDVIAGLEKSLVELEEAVSELRVTARRTGTVVSEHPERLLGQYVRRGDLLVRVADPDDKELLVVFPEAEWASYTPAVSGDQPLTARLRGGRRLAVRPQPAHPRFSDSLPHPAFAGTNGGDIGVVPDGDSPTGFRSRRPLGEATAAVSRTDSKQIEAGCRGRLYLSDTRSLVERLWILLTDD